jgi:thiol-disulfide isomerase/thioredoxin
MKRSILIALLTVFVAVSASAQRKVLIEEFTSSTCGPCASTDPLMEQFEEEYIDKVVVLKYHQDYPTSGDIMYTAYTKGYDRGNLYSVHQTGIPWVEFNGMINKNPGVGVDALKATVDEVMDQSPIYYTLNVRQQVTADSIIAFVTVKAGAQVDPEARLVVVIAEANVLHQASNGRIYHTSVARGALPEFNTAGEPTGDALTIAANGEQTFRLAAKLKTAWNKGLLQVVAFVQNPSSKEVMGVETTKPYVTLSHKGASGSIVGHSTIQPHYILKNAGSTAQTVVLSSGFTKTAPYASTIKTVDGTVVGAAGITLAPGEEKEIVLSVGTSGANVEKQNYSINLATSEGVGIIGAGGLAWPAEKTDLLVNAGLSSYAQTSGVPTKYTAALTAAGSPVGTIGYSELLDGFSDLTAFKNIFWGGGYTVGLYTGTGDLSMSDTNKIRQFIANGGNIAFSSVVMASVYNNAGLGDFVEEVFGVRSDEYVKTEMIELRGVAGDPISSGIQTEVAQTLWTQPLEVSDLNPTSKAIFSNENDEIVAVRTEHASGGKAVYFSFEPGNITSTVDRKAVIKNVLDWFNGVSDVAPKTEVAGFVLKQNYPNPFNPSTEISFELPRRSSVSLVVQDMMGREVATLIQNQSIDAGSKTVKFDASNLASGNYVYVLTVDGQRLDRKMTLAK